MNEGVWITNAYAFVATLVGVVAFVVALLWPYAKQAWIEDREQRRSERVERRRRAA